MPAHSGQERGAGTPASETLQVDAVVARATLLLDAGQNDEAAVLLTSADPRFPGDYRLAELNGRALLALGRPEPALGALFTALDLAPRQASIHYHLACALSQVGDLEQALVHGIAAFTLDPDHAVAIILGGVLARLGHFEQALALASQALGLRPNGPMGLANLATALLGLGQTEASLAARRAAVAAAPGDGAAKRDLAATLLLLGQLTPEAWDLHESRRPHQAGADAPPGMPRWIGEDSTGRTILLQAEPEFGDTLQFLRFAPMVAERVGRVMLAVQAPLLRLLRTVPGVDLVVDIDGDLPPFDMCCALMSLPRIFGATLASIPAALPYADAFAPWDDGLFGLRVGLAWSVGTARPADRDRSIAPLALTVLAGIPDVQFYSLQFHEGLPTPLPVGLDAVDRMLGVQDFADTAAVVAGLDLIVTVDTAVAHLAATMAKPVLLLCPFFGCWRWLRGRDDSPWYPTLKIIRQSRPNDWSGPLQQIRSEIAARAAAPMPRNASPGRRAPAPKLLPCKACGVASIPLGSVDFNKNCEDRRRTALPPSGRPVLYYRCPACSLVFTADFDAWTRADFRTHIYNDAYADVDRDYASVRPANSAALIGTLFGDACRGIDVLDYGGGDGVLAGLLTQQHGMNADTYDPFNPACDVLPRRCYPLVTCFEVMEHTPNPRATLREIASLVNLDGLVVFSTLLQPNDFEHQGLNWWYVAPRNGHVTIFSAASLAALWGEFGFKLISRTADLHLAFRTLPAFARHLDPAASVQAALPYRSG